MLPEIPDTNASKSGRERVIELAKREKLNVRQLAQRLGGYGGLAFVGTPSVIADQMEEWLVSGGSDGFNVMFPYLPGGLDDFVDRVVPELQRRGIFRHEYSGKRYARTSACRGQKTASSNPDTRNEPAPVGRVSALVMDCYPVADAQPRSASHLAKLTWRQHPHA